MYGQTLMQKRSAQCSSRQIDTQSWLLLLSGSLGYQFTKSSVLLSDIQENVPSSYMSFPPIQYSQHFHHSDEDKADSKKKYVMKNKKIICQHYQYNPARLYLIRVVYIALVINLEFITQGMLYQTPVEITFDTIPYF